MFIINDKLSIKFEFYLKLFFFKFKSKQNTIY